ncbi:hypothetical protein PPL_01326 [Heterostelium album PN500]|uniref:B box-type domain-containing protein n=1 Tax=Heterostelium pallidum (strain ATCC 26659 / Pp 5 / PN500) TaxID=670386 RepID=D3AYR2_HETP5|nr:hypothetical protein PPL_01326 [Heterostelium album PN500]EFA86089.1 hypothetical protein PPL_01326 [Heterostelium album PN500]|eukprot:XP_020438195.1 hypothetical protein PPL_01326 [Heterostelium album PN500]
MQLTKYHCAEHDNRQHEFICYQCNSLMCSRCIVTHSNEHPDHSLQYEHIDDIRQSLNNLYPTDSDNNNNTNNNNNNNDTESKFNKNVRFTINSLWRSLKTSSSKYQSLSTSESDITQHFDQLRQYINNEEQKLKQSITNDKDTVFNQMDNDLNHLKHIVNIVSLNNKLQNDNNNNQCKEEEEEEDVNTSAMIESIASSSSVQSFIKDNRQSLQLVSQSNNDIEDSLRQNNNSKSTLLLDVIYNYNNQFKTKTTDNKNNNNNLVSSYEVTTKPIDFEPLNSMIEQSIKLTKIEPSTYILSTHRAKGATLINLSNNSTAEEIKADFDFFGTFQSVVTVGEYIYIFGPGDNPNKWMKFSIKTKSIEHIGEIEGEDHCFYKSVCYDGLDHIYLISGREFSESDQTYSARMDRLNINTMKIERCPDLPELCGYQVSSMIYNGQLYSLSMKNSWLYQYDLATSKALPEYYNYIKAFSACHDNNGNFYIFDEEEKRFARFNVETKEVTELSFVEPHDAYLMYHRESPTSSFIYSMGGNHGNFKYSIEENRSEPFYPNDKLDRICCASAVIKF